MTDTNDNGERALTQYQWSLQRLMANMLRVSRGAGKPWEIAGDATDLVSAFEAYRDATGQWPSSDQTASAISLPECPEGVMGEEANFFYAERAMISGAMQIVASEMLGQRTQVSAGQRQLHDGWSMKLDYVKRAGGIL